MKFLLVTLFSLLCAAATTEAADVALQTANGQKQNAGVGNMSCPPEFLTDVERRMYAKDNNVRSGPWHVRCFQNGTGIYDRDHVYVFCQKGDTTASIEAGTGQSIRFQFPPEVACVWER